MTVTLYSKLKYVLKDFRQEQVRGYSKKESQQNAAQMAIKKVKEPTFMSTIEEIKIQHSATETETEMEVELATGSDTELATELENELETELNANPEIKPENVSEENILVDEISTVQDTESSGN